MARRRYAKGSWSFDPRSLSENRHLRGIRYRVTGPKGLTLWIRPLPPEKKNRPPT